MVATSLMWFGNLFDSLIADAWKDFVLYITIFLFVPSTVNRSSDRLDIFVLFHSIH